jgi:hypothetical protein
MIFYSWKQVDGQPGLRHRRVALSAGAITLAKKPGKKFRIDERR